MMLKLPKSKIFKFSLNFKVLCTINSNTVRFTRIMKALITHYRTLYITGLILNLVSFLIYLFTPSDVRGNDIFSIVFFVNYGIAFGYAVFMLINKLQYSKPRPPIFIGCWVNAAVLFTISAFSLNKQMGVFAPFPTWLNVMTLTMTAIFFLYPYINNFPPLIKGTIYFLSGSALVLSLYMFIFLLPLTIIGIIAFWFFGISLHAFVPALWILLILNLFFRKTNKASLKHLGWAGAAIPVIFLSFYLYKWNNVQTGIKDILAEKYLQTDNHLPADIYLAQKLPDDALTEEILISPFKSQQFWEDGLGLGFGMSGIKKFHDPLAVIAVGFFGKLDIDENTVTALLNIRRDYRHHTTEKLWIGSSLSTSSVSNNIRVYPEYRLAYQEKTIVIHHTGMTESENWWFNSQTQEALYTFHVPEGSIVTSLSLWINGKEEKSRLTTLQKADSAYKNIVGVQRRDPAIVHWQEGNRITVNVFPCTEKEDRIFKIGFTTPMAYRDNKLWLKNIWFEGPEFSSAREFTNIRFGQQPTPVTDFPSDFEKTAEGGLNYKGDYNPSWEIAFTAVPLSNKRFAFNGFEYAVSEMTETKTALNTKSVFLDITNEWTKDDYENCISGLNEKEIYTWTPELVKITGANKEEAWEKLKENKFSLPFLYDIKDPASSVVITKADERSPLLADLAGSEYASKITSYLENANGKIRLLNIGDKLSPFWKSLNELRVTEYIKLKPEEAIGSIKAGNFQRPYEDSLNIALVESHLKIVKSPVDSGFINSGAPDHLLRVFEYNDVLRKLGKHYFKKENYESALFREAEEGYVVTPLTSMLVLESQADYERFGIKENVNTVGNAGVLGGGAVPEPHEWALIILVALIIGYHLYLRKKKINGAHS